MTDSLSSGSGERRDLSLSLSVFVSASGKRDMLPFLLSPSVAGHEENRSNVHRISTHASATHGCSERERVCVCEGGSPALWRVFKGTLLR